jgi:hypothetical protein
MMIELQDLHKYACTQFNMHFTSCAKFKSDFSVFQVPFKNPLSRLALMLHEELSGTDFFVTVFWITFIVAVIGLFEACCETIRLFVDDSYEPMTFGNRSYHYVTLKFRRQARVFGAVLNIKLFLGLLYGLLWRRTSYILPWIAVYGAIIPLEVVYWMCDIFNNRKWKCEPIIWLFKLSIRWALTLHIMILMNKIRFE